jgi:hypothetical protein
MAAIGLMHLIFARRLTSAASSSSPMASESSTDPAADPPSGEGGALISLPVRFPAPIRELGAGGSRLALPGPRFPNLMR